MNQLDDSEPKASNYKPINCMWASYKQTPCSFKCELRNLESKKITEVLNWCNVCCNFRDTNIDIDDGYSDYNTVYNV